MEPEARKEGYEIMDLHHLWDSLTDALQAVDLSSIHQIADFSEALSGARIDVSGFTDDQLDYMLKHIPHDLVQEGMASTSSQPLFGSWE